MDNSFSKIYLLTDTHFLHEKIITDFGFRPANFTQLIINNWKSTVKDIDVVYHLGDVIWGDKEQLKGILNQLPGNKILVRGNHDKNHSNNWFMEAGFNAVLEKVQVSGAILSHMPSNLSQEEIDRGLINIFGHFHNNPPDRWEEYLKERLTENHYLLSIEEVGYRPIPLLEAKKGKYVKNAKMMLQKQDINI